MFRRRSDEQALQHVRHKVKRDVECRVDGRFTCITALETHLRALVDKLRPRDYYNELRREFGAMLSTDDYKGVLRVFNHKPMLTDCNVAQLLGYKRKEDYIAGVIGTLKGTGKDASDLRDAIKRCFGLRSDETYFPDAAPMPKPPKTKAVQHEGTQVRHTEQKNRFKPTQRRNRR